VTTTAHTRSMADLLAGWLVGQRWYAGKGTDLAELHRIGGVRLMSPSPPRVDDAPTGTAKDAEQVEVEIHVVRVITTDGGSSVYQVPLTYRSLPEPGLTHALVGSFADPLHGKSWVYDGPHDPVFVTALLNLLNGGRAPFAGGTASGTTGEGAGSTPGGAVGVMQRSRPPAPGPAQVLVGEQSNTSIIVGLNGPDPTIVKLFRVLHPGTNPDVVVQTRLAVAGCERVPRPVGWVVGSWPDHRDEELVEGHLAYACEFVTDGEDAWRVACRAVETGTPFADRARGLGLATAEVHTALAEALPTIPTDGAALARIADDLVGRVRWAVETVPSLEPFAAAAVKAVDAVRALVEGPDLQQVHGDYHLGQVLHSPTRGWVLLDFEGEPLRPLAERLKPDLALRDVAGMLRSFDYAARHATVGLPADDPRTVTAQEWSSQARGAFLAGYQAGGGKIDGDESSPHATLLRALEIDKAMYEVVYETLNRPSWVDIPLSALRRLTAS
jgi:predicted trehalose synthase